MLGILCIRKGAIMGAVLEKNQDVRSRSAPGETRAALATMLDYAIEEGIDLNNPIFVYLLRMAKRSLLEHKLSAMPIQSAQV
jgi:hypothetical protein